MQGKYTVLSLVPPSFLIDKEARYEVSRTLAYGLTCHWRRGQERTQTSKHLMAMKSLGSLRLPHHLITLYYRGSMVAAQVIRNSVT